MASPESKTREMKKLGFDILTPKYFRLSRGIEGHNSA
jgi:hypothetical protein